MTDLRDPGVSVAAVCTALALAPHPEGGHFRELHRDQPGNGTRGTVTSILFLLAEGERSRPHRVDATEVWLWHAGAPLVLVVAGRQMRLGPNLGAGEVLQATVPPDAWQEARTTGAWTLVGCVVAPAFEFAGFELEADAVPSGRASPGPGSVMG